MRYDNIGSSKGKEWEKWINEFVDVACREGEDVTINGKIDDDLDELVYIIAIDLEHYVPNEKHRREEPCYYGDEKLFQVIKKSKEKLNSFETKCIK